MTWPNDKVTGYIATTGGMTDTTEDSDSSDDLAVTWVLLI